MQNALAPEEKPIIENIISLFQQLLSMQDSQAATAAPAEVAEAMEDEEMDEVDVKKSSDGETGDDNAEKRIEEITPLTDSSLADLKKSIDALVNSRTQRQVVKTQTVKKDNTNSALNQIAAVLKTIVEKQNNQEALNTQLFDALGFTEEVVKKALPENVVKKDKPMQSRDTQAFMMEFVKAFKSANAEPINEHRNHPFNKNKDVRKDLQGLASYIHNTCNKR